MLTAREASRSTMFAKKLTFLCPWISLFTLLLAISPRCYAEDHLGEDLDEKIAFVSGQQQSMLFAPISANHSTGYIVYCPCMGKL